MPNELKRQLETLQKHRKTVLEPFGVKTIGIFGSVARGKQTKKSDVDVLVDFFSPPGFFHFIALEEKLSTLLGRKVDLTTKRSLKPQIKKKVMRDIVYIAS